MCIDVVCKFMPCNFSLVGGKETTSIMTLESLILKSRRIQLVFAKERNMPCDFSVKTSSGLEFLQNAVKNSRPANQPFVVKHSTTDQFSPENATLVSASASGRNANTIPFDSATGLLIIQLEPKFR